MVISNAEAISAIFHSLRGKRLRVFVSFVQGRDLKSVSDELNLDQEELTDILADFKEHRYLEITEEGMELTRYGSFIFKILVKIDRKITIYQFEQRMEQQEIIREISETTPEFPGITSEQRDLLKEVTSEWYDTLRKAVGEESE